MAEWLLSWRGNHFIWERIQLCLLYLQSLEKRHYYLACSWVVHYISFKVCLLLHFMQNLGKKKMMMIIIMKSCFILSWLLCLLSLLWWSWSFKTILYVVVLVMCVHFCSLLSFCLMIWLICFAYFPYEPPPSLSLSYSCPTHNHFLTVFSLREKNTYTHLIISYGLRCRSHFFDFVVVQITLCWVVQKWEQRQRNTWHDLGSVAADFMAKWTPSFLVHMKWHCHEDRNDDETHVFLSPRQSDRNHVSSQKLLISQSMTGILLLWKSFRPDHDDWQWKKWDYTFFALETHMTKIICLVVFECPIHLVVSVFMRSFSLSMYHHQCWQT